MTVMASISIATYAIVALVVAVRDRADLALVVGGEGGVVCRARGEWGSTVLFSAIWPIYLILVVVDAWEGSTSSSSSSR